MDKLPIGPFLFVAQPAGAGGKHHSPLADGVQRPRDQGFIVRSD